MTRHPHRFDVILTLTAPVLTKTSGAIGLGLDAAMLRDSQGRPAFYQSHIKGKLREAWNILTEATGEPGQAFIDHWLGEKSRGGSSDEPLRGELSFDAYWHDADWKPGDRSQRRYRVRVDPETGAVDSGALQVIESPWPSGATVHFNGAIHVRATDSERDTLLRFLQLGFNLIPALGALKGNGFGRLQEAKVRWASVKPNRQTLSAKVAASDRVGLRLRPSDPFCFARRAIGAQNNSVAEDHIPGAALIAALHRRIAAEPAEYPVLARSLDQLAVSHARPATTNATVRPVAVPLSLVKLDAGFIDCTNIEQPGTINGEVPAFFIDWKDQDWTAIHARLNPTRGQPAKRLLIRTEIDPKSQTSAEQRLFSVETVVPDGCDWLANLDLGSVDAPARVLQELAKLFALPLTHLGKTKVRATVTIEPPFTRSLADGPVAGPQVIVHLQSPAVLLPPGFTAPATNGGAALSAAYGAVWDSLSGHTLRLSRFFASQQLVGGSYWWHRYRQPDPIPSGPYRPRVMTMEGSVFVFDIVDLDGAQTRLEAWCRRGLPQLAGTPGGEDWRYNPWIASNGFGEIAVNLNLDAALRRPIP